jgi:hypothetical protein
MAWRRSVAPIAAMPLLASAPPRDRRATLNCERMADALAAGFPLLELIEHDLPTREVSNG